MSNPKRPTIDDRRNNNEMNLNSKTVPLISNGRTKEIFYNCQVKQF
jgi:hypothetical protein